MIDADWKNVWQTRGKDYHSANAANPRARETERCLLLDRLDLKPGQVLLDVAAGGGYLLEKVHHRFSNQVQLLAIESSETFASHLPDYVSHLKHGSITEFPMSDASVDRVSNLSGLHHTTDRSRFFHEGFRVLKKGGILGAADVRKNSAVGEWLNGFVDRHNPQGHKGQFFPEGEMTQLLSSAGFSRISEQTERYTWDFDSVEGMVWFCRTLFGLNADDSTILEGISKTIGYQDSGSAVRMNWELIYATGQKDI